ncbi:MAG: PAS domain-containing protein [Desulfobulbaceae bacterium]|nr:PAS domain-containing protein [Desulfobulbaceae bacterium]
MTAKTRTICIMWLIIIGLSLVFLFTLLSQQQRFVRHVIQNQNEAVALSVRQSKERLSSIYQARVRSFTERHRDVILAFASGDRDLLKKLVMPLQRMLKQENQFFTSIHFILPDNRFFLRGCVPEKFGDDVTRMSSQVDEVNRIRQQTAGFEIACKGLQYRIMGPVFVDDRYIGLVGFCIDATYLLVDVGGMEQTKLTLFYDKKEAEKAEFSDQPFRVMGNYAILQSDPMFSQLPENIDLDVELQRVSIDNKIYARSCNTILSNFQGQSVARLLGASDITEFIDQARRTVVITVILVLVLLALTLFVLQLNFNSLVNKILDLNRSLEESYRNVELQVEERTAQLQSEVEERKRTEAAMARAKNDWERTFDAVQDMVAIIDPDFRIIRANRFMADKLGLPVEQLVGKTCHQAVHHTDVPPPVCPHVQLLHDHEVHAVEFYDEYQQAWLSVSVAPLYEIDGSFVGSVHVVRDITSGKIAEQTIREQEERLYLALYGADLGMWDWNIQTGEVVCNARRYEMLGYRAGEIDPHVGSWTDQIHPDDLQEVTNILEAHLQGKTDYHEAEYRMRHKSGKWIWILNKGKVIKRDDEGRPLRAVGTHLDITERKELEQQKQSMARQLGEMQRHASLNRMAGAVAHHFNNKMMVVQGNLELLQLYLPGDAKTEPLAADAMKAAQESSRLSSYLLTCLGQRPSSKKLLDLSSLLGDMRDVFPSREGVDIDFGLTLPEQPLPCEIDTEQIRQVITSLVFNAAEAITGSAGRITLTAGISREEMKDLPAPFMDREYATGDYVFCEVADNGCGMDEKTKDQMFDPFFSTKGINRGLELAIAAGILKVHYGVMTVVSEPGQGTTVRMLLPAAEKGTEG